MAPLIDSNEIPTLNEKNPATLTSSNVNVAAWSRQAPCPREQQQWRRGRQRRLTSGSRRRRLWRHASARHQRQGLPVQPRPRSARERKAGSSVESAAPDGLRRLRPLSQDLLLPWVDRRRGARLWPRPDRRLLHRRPETLRSHLAAKIVSLHARKVRLKLYYKKCIILLSKVEWLSTKDSSDKLGSLIKAHLKPGSLKPE